MNSAPSLLTRFLWWAGSLFAGLLAGSGVNVALIQVGVWLFPLVPSGGGDASDPAVLNAAIAAADPPRLLPPFIAHAGGTFVGALVASAIARTRRSGMIAALQIGCLFLIGGIMMVRALPATPTWWVLLDLIGAYIPMAAAGWAVVRGWKR